MIICVVGVFIGWNICRVCVLGFIFCVLDAKFHILVKVKGIFMIRRVTIRRVTRELLRNVQDDVSVDAFVNSLLDCLGDDLGNSDLFHVGHTTVDLDVDTIRRLEEYRLYDNEPYDSILFRAIDLYTRRL